MGLPWQIILPAGKSTSIFLNAKFWSLLTLWVVWFKRKQGSHRHGIRALSLCTWAGVWVWEKRRCRGSILPPCTQIIFLNSPGCCVHLWLNALGQCASPQFRQGWETWKLANVFLGLELRGGSLLRRSEPYNPKEGFTKPRANPTVQHHDCTRGSGAPTQPGQHFQKNSWSRSQMVSQKTNAAVDPTQWTRPFPMHTYLERAVKLKWTLLYMLMLMVTVIKNNSIYSMSQVEQESMGFSPVGFHRGVMTKGDNLMHEHLQDRQAIDTNKQIP